jgi:hypothetical protein
MKKAQVDKLYYAAEEAFDALEQLNASSDSMPEKRYLRLRKKAVKRWDRRATAWQQASERRLRRKKVVHHVRRRNRG